MVINNLILYITFLLITIFYQVFNISIDNPNIYITISTFLFAIFVSYFIKRQGSRYDKIRQQVAINDGHFSTIFRLFSNFSQPAWKKAGKIIKQHFSNIIGHKDWVYNIRHKTTTLTDLNNLIAKETGNKNLNTLQAQSLRQIQSSLANLQITRKTIWTLYKEKLTIGQWFLIFFLTGLLLFTISFIKNNNFIIYIAKVFFGFIVILVIALLYKLNSFRLFKDYYGKQSSLDVINIIEGKK